jgi:hypothetical protein
VSNELTLSTNKKSQLLAGFFYWRWMGVSLRNWSHFFGISKIKAPKPFSSIPKSSIKIRCFHLIHFAKNRKGFAVGFEPFTIGYFWIFLWIFSFLSSMLLTANLINKIFYA